MRPFKNAQRAVTNAAAGAGRTVSAAAAIAAAAVLLLVGVVLGVLIARTS